jgi:hypothetical protein
MWFFFVREVELSQVRSQLLFAWFVSFLELSKVVKQREVGEAWGLIIHFA